LERAAYGPPFFCVRISQAKKNQRERWFSGNTVSL
jgi:hypothetical protein